MSSHHLRSSETGCPRPTLYQRYSGQGRARRSTGHRSAPTRSSSPSRCPCSLSGRIPLLSRMQSPWRRPPLASAARRRVRYAPCPRWEGPCRVSSSSCPHCRCGRSSPQGHRRSTCPCAAAAGRLLRRWCRASSGQRQCPRFPCSPRSSELPPRSCPRRWFCRAHDPRPPTRVAPAQPHRPCRACVGQLKFCRYARTSPAPSSAMSYLHPEIYTRHRQSPHSAAMSSRPCLARGRLGSLGQSPRSPASTSRSCQRWG